MRGTPPLRVVISASPEDAPWRTRLVGHLSALKRFRNVEVWTDDDVPAGVDRRMAVDRELGRADVALLLVSASYLASDFLQDVEVPQLFERHQTGGVKVIPVLVGSCTWELHPWIGKLLPEGEQPVAAIAGDGQDRALAEVVREILRQAKVEVPPEREARGWAWHGSRGSADSGVISVLAIVETLAAMAVYGYIAVRYGTLHLTVSACVAPLLLLSTPESRQMGLAYGLPAVQSALMRIRRLADIVERRLFPPRETQPRAGSGENAHASPRPIKTITIPEKIGNAIGSTIVVSVHGAYGHDPT